MATFSKKVMGKEVGDASVYAEPHTMTGKIVRVEANPGTDPYCSNPASSRMSLGNMEQKPAKGIKTDGIKIRGIGAAIRGTMARGPMG